MTHGAIKARPRHLYGLAYAQEAIVGLVAVVGIAASLVVSTLQRRRELGFLRAQGATRSQIVSVVLAEAIILAATGALIGLFIGVGLDWYTQNVILADKTGFLLPFQLPVIESILAVSHSILPLPSTRKRLSRFIPVPQYGVFFCVMTCLSLWATILLWKSCPMAVWDKSGIEGSVIHAALIVSWLSLFYSISLTGFGYETGWTTWWAWFRGKKIAPRQFASHGAYRFFRHPIYLNFMGLIWSNPSMTADRFVLAVVWTIYIFIGSELKDRRLEFYTGDAYRAYRKRIPAYPWNANPRVIAQVLRRRYAQNSTHS